MCNECVQKPNLDHIPNSILLLQATSSNQTISLVLVDLRWLTSGRPCYSAMRCNPENSETMPSSVVFSYCVCIVCAIVLEHCNCRILENTVLKMTRPSLLRHSSDCPYAQEWVDISFLRSKLKKIVVWISVMLTHFLDFLCLRVNIFKRDIFVYEEKIDSGCSRLSRLTPLCS